MINLLVKMMYWLAGPEFKKNEKKLLERQEMIEYSEG